MGKCTRGRRASASSGRCQDAFGDRLKTKNTLPCRQIPPTRHDSGAGGGRGASWARPRSHTAVASCATLEEWDRTAAYCAALCFVVSTVVVLVFTGFSGFGLSISIVDEDPDSGNLLEFWELKCDRPVCWAHEIIGRILVAVATFMALQFLWLCCCMSLGVARAFVEECDD